MTRSSHIEWDGHPPPCWDGWRASKETWTYNQSFAPVYQIVSSAGDFTATWKAGMKIKLTHGGVTKYFLVMGDSWYGFGATGMYIYGGTDYTLSAGALTDFQYSTDHVPVGFPASPLKWTERYADSTDRILTVADTDWHNSADAGTFGHIHIPYGLWRVTYNVTIGATSDAAQTSAAVLATLSKADNTEDDAEFTSRMYQGGASGTLSIIGTVMRSKIVAQVASETPVIHYLNLKTTSANTDTIVCHNASTGTMYIEAECAYL